MTESQLGDMARRLARASVVSDVDYDKLVEHYKAQDRDPAMILYDIEDGIRLAFGLRVN